MPKARQSPPIANPAARAQLERAAEAAGLSVVQLADLVFEAGVAPPKAPDGTIQRYTLQDLGEKLWGAMQPIPKDERMRWFGELVPTQQMALVTVLRDHGFRSEVIARDLGIGVDVVMRMWASYASKLGEQVVGIRLDTIAGSLQLASERAQEMALADHNPAVFWRIEKEKIELLQSIGIVEKAIHKTEVTHKIDDAQKAELEEFARLRHKQNKRKIEVEELKQIENTGEELPDDLQGKDYDDEDE